MITEEIASEALDVFKRRSGAYCDVNGLGKDWEQRFADSYYKLTKPGTQRLFKIGFALAASGQRLTAKEYEIATGWSFDTDEEYREHLRRLWDFHFPHESPEHYLET
ncbi:MAG: hypothetical protein K8H88_14100 [Sandaracinaceae bacterium]|nr:hypothetical protein [Sandaracinaceae bacterium]